MKTIVLIGLALLGCYCHVNLAILNRGIAQEINRVRSQIADKNGIANMNQMVYDKALESSVITALEKNGCPNKKVWKIGDLEVIPMHARLALAQASTDPGRNKFAFFNHSCSGKLFVFDTNPNFSPITGAPGTRCPGNRQVNGLCGNKKGYTRKVVTDEEVKAFLTWITGGG